MFPSILYGAVLASLFTFVSASPFTPIESRQTLTPPTQDPFYVPPEGYEATALGTILRSRPPPALLAAFDIVPLNLNASYQILYRTEDATGNPSATVTTVLIPHNANYSRLVSYQDFEDAADFDCATSYGIQQISSLDTMDSKVNVILIGGMLYNGWVVALPDYEGPLAAVFSGVQGGKATLDGIRAVLNSQSLTGIAAKEDVDVQMMGYSGGSIPTEWAAELQPTYAKELTIKGAAIGGTIANLSSSILTINNGIFAGFGFAGILGLLKSYPNVTDFIYSELIPEKADDFFRPLDSCGVADIVDFAFQDIGSYFRDGMSIFATPQAQSIFQAGGEMGFHGLPKTPLYFYKTVGDEIDHISDNDVLVNMYCNQNINSLMYVRNAVGDHVMETFLGAGGAIGFLSDRFNGVPPVQGCNIQNVLIAQPDFSAFTGYASEIAGLVAELLAAPIGWMSVAYRNNNSS